MKAHFGMLARYNRWANQRVYRAVAVLPEADWRADHGAFFHSLDGTLNHLVVADRIWLRRCTGIGPLPTRLDEIVSHDRAELAAARAAEDDRLIAYIDGLDEAHLAGPLTYSPLTAQGSFTQPLAAVLAHIFNHQTHHRGQATALLTRIGGRNACESLDLAAFQRESGIGLIPS